LVNKKATEIRGKVEKAKEAAEHFSIENIIKGRLKSSEFVKGFVDCLKRQLPYLISFVLSGVYFYYFNFGEVPKCDNYQDGFCVTGLEVIKDANGEPITDSSEKIIKKCLDPLRNSHKWAWCEDVIFTIIAIILPFTKYRGENAKSLATRIAIPLIIIGHGAIHKFFSVQQCYVAPTGNILELATTLYNIFVTALTGIMFFLFSDLPAQRGVPFTLVEVALISFLIVAASLDKVKDGNAVSALFMASQLLIGYLGAFHPSELATKLVGQTFVFPCAVSLLEFLKCDFLEKIGGHAWYDFTLHISVVASFLPSDWDLFDLFRSKGAKVVKE